jgi:hypothetical protein
MVVVIVDCRLGEAVADAVGEIYLNNQKADYYVGWVERKRNPTFLKP